MSNQLPNKNWKDPSQE